MLMQKKFNSATVNNFNSIEIAPGGCCCSCCCTCCCCANIGVGNSSSN